MPHTRLVINAFKMNKNKKNVKFYTDNRKISDYLYKI